MDATNTVWKLYNEIDKKKGISELIINGPEHVYIERNGELIRLNAEVTAADITSFCQKLAEYNKAKFNQQHPILNGLLPDGSRLNIISKEYTGNYPAITIRRYNKSLTSFDELKGEFELTPKWVDFLKALVKSKMNILVAGGTGVGKTTFLNLLLQEIHPTERVITIEDTKELSFDIPNNIRLISKEMDSDSKSTLNTRDLIKNTLRMRPDRIIIGEVRGGEAFDLLQLLNTGHNGSMCTVHANSSAEALSRIENLYLMAGFDVPQKSVREQISTAFDFVIHLKKNRDGKRIISSITELSNMEGDVILTQSIARHEDKGPEFTGLVPKRMSDLKEFGIDSDFFMEI